MRFWTCVLVGLVLMMSLNGAQAQSVVSPAGIWRTVSDTDGKPRARVRIELNGDRARGIVIGSLREGEDPARLCDRCKGAQRNRPIMGMEILSGLTRSAQNPLEYAGGSVLDPDTGATYNARFRLSADGRTLTLRGFIGHPTLGRSQVWTRE